MNRSQALLDCEEGHDKTLEDLLEAVRSPQGSKEFEVKDVTPVPCFVVKTKDEKHEKVFINICGCVDVPAPGDWKDGKVPKEVVTALKSSSASEDALRFPLSSSVSRVDSDKQGEPCVVYDCLFNLDVVLAAKRHRKLKIFLVGLAIEWIAHKNGVQLSPEYKIPKMHYKGKEVQSHRVKVRKGPMVQELRDVSADDASTALPLDKAPVQDPKEESAPLTELKYTIHYDSRPVDNVVVEFELPDVAGEENVEVWLSAFRLNVAVTGVTERSVVELPFAVDGRRSRVEFCTDPRRMCVTLPFKPISNVLDELRGDDDNSQRALLPLQSQQCLSFETVAL